MNNFNSHVIVHSAIFTMFKYLIFTRLKYLRNFRRNLLNFIWFFLPKYLINVNFDWRLFLLFGFINFLNTFFTFLPLLLTLFLGSRTVYLSNSFGSDNFFYILIFIFLIFSFRILFILRLIQFTVFLLQLTFILFWKWDRLMSIMRIFNNFPL